MGLTCVGSILLFDSVSLSFPIFGSFLSHYFCQYFFCPTFFLFMFWDSVVTQILIFCYSPTGPQGSLSLGVCFPSYFLCCSAWVMFIDTSAVSPSTEIFTLVIVAFSSEISIWFFISFISLLRLKGFL